MCLRERESYSEKGGGRERVIQTSNRKRQDKRGRVETEKDREYYILILTIKYFEYREREREKSISNIFITFLPLNILNAVAAGPTLAFL